MGPCTPHHDGRLLCSLHFATIFFFFFLNNQVASLHMQIPSDWLPGSLISKYTVPTASWEYLWGYFAVTECTAVTAKYPQRYSQLAEVTACTAVFRHSSSRVPLEVLQLAVVTVICIIWDLGSLLEKSECECEQLVFLGRIKELFRMGKKVIFF